MIQGLQVTSADKEELLNQVNQVVQLLQSALSLKNFTKQAKKDLQKSQHQLSDSLTQKESLSHKLDALNNQKKQIDLNDKQVIDHYSKLRDDALEDLDALKRDKSERTLALQELSESLKGLREKLQGEKKEMASRQKDQQTQMSEGVKRMEQIEAYLQGYIERLRNGVLAIPDLN